MNYNANVRFNLSGGRLQPKCKKMFLELQTRQLQGALPPDTLTRGFALGAHWPLGALPQTPIYACSLCSICWEIGRLASTG